MITRRGLLSFPYNLHMKLITKNMKLILICIIGVLLWNSTDARQFTSNQLQNASDFIEPKPQSLQDQVNKLLKK